MSKARRLVQAVLALSVVFAFSFPYVAAYAATKEVRFKDTPLELAPGAKIIVSGLKGTVRLTALAPGKPAVLHGKKIASSSGATDKFESLGYIVRKEGDAVIIETKGPELGAEAQGWWGSGAPEMQLDIEAPPVPVEIAWREGQVNAQSWKGPIAVSLVEGSVKLSSGEGQVRAQVQKGEIRVDDHRGRLDLDTYGAKVQVAKVEGDVTLASFSGESSISQVRGSLQIQAGSGSVLITKATGAIDFDLVRATLNVNEFEGAVHGQTDDGAVSAQILGEADVSIQSKQAAVSVKLPAGSGAALRLRSEEGAINAPEGVSVGKTGEIKTASGRLTGSGPKGSVVVSSQAGAIRVR